MLYNWVGVLGQGRDSRTERSDLGQGGYRWWGRSSRTEMWVFDKNGTLGGLGIPESLCDGNRAQ